MLKDLTKSDMLFVYAGCWLGKEVDMQQNYPENVIVTVRMKSLDLEADVRLPADSVFENWLPELTWVLNQYRSTYLDPRTLTVSHSGRKLQSNDSLASLGIWDGSVLLLEKR